MGLDQTITYNVECSNYDVGFRKANFLQGYFERIHNVENCVPVDIDNDDIDYMLEHAGHILELAAANKEWIGYAKRYLPTTMGFFYGSLEYDKWYLQDMRKVYDTFKTMAEVCDKYDDAAPTYFCWY